MDLPVRYRSSDLQRGGGRHRRKLLVLLAGGGAVKSDMPHALLAESCCPSDNLNVTVDDTCGQHVRVVAWRDGTARWFRAAELLQHAGGPVKAAFHGTDTDILATMSERMSVSVSWNAAFTVFVWVTVFGWRTTSVSRPTQPFTIGWTRNEYRPWSSGSFHLWTHVWVAGKAV